MATKQVFRRTRALAQTGIILAAGALSATGIAQQPASFGPSNPFYAPSTLPFQIGRAHV